MGNKVGRPTKYKEEYNEQVIKLALLGATDKEIANFFNICEATLNNWKIDEPEFLESLKKGKMEADINVANSLYNRALGYEYEEVKTEDGETYKITKTKKHMPADVAAMNIWLKNRRGNINSKDGIRWADKQDIDVKDERRTLDNDEREKRIAELKLKLGVRE